jgi:hypothetical protein
MVIMSILTTSDTGVAIAVMLGQSGIDLCIEPHRSSIEPGISYKRWIDTRNAF